MGGRCLAECVTCCVHTQPVLEVVYRLHTEELLTLHYTLTRYTRVHTRTKVVMVTGKHYHAGKCFASLMLLGSGQLARLMMSLST